MINPQDIILAIESVVMGKHPGDIVDALLSCSVTLVQQTSNLTEQDFVDRAREIWKAYEENKMEGRS